MAEKKKKAEKCRAMKRNCGHILSDGSACMHHYKSEDKESAICPVCGTIRTRCGHWPLKGSKYCKYHGGSAGRPRTHAEDIKTFTPEEYAEIQRAAERKIRHTELTYQMAYAALCKIKDENEGKKNFGQIMLNSISTYMTKIEKVASEVKLDQAQTENINLMVGYDDITKEMLDDLRKSAFITGCETTANAFLKVMMVAIPEKDRRIKIVNELPEIIKKFATENFKELE